MLHSKSIANKRQFCFWSIRFHSGWIVTEENQPFYSEQTWFNIKTRNYYSWKQKKREFMSLQEREIVGEDNRRRSKQPWQHNSGLNASCREKWVLQKRSFEPITPTPAIHSRPTYFLSFRSRNPHHKSRYLVFEFFKPTSLSSLLTSRSLKKLSISKCSGTLDVSFFFFVFRSLWLKGSLSQ